MSQKKGVLHPRNPHQGRYDFKALCVSEPSLKAFIKPNPKGDDTIDFSDSLAVIALNKALLAHFYQVKQWQLPQGYLCPPIPGRADYIHYLADLLGGSGEIPQGKKVRVLDIGTGANCIYPIIGSQSYGWSFVGTDIDPVSINVAKVIVESNPCLSKLIKLLLQPNSDAIFDGIIKPNDHFDLTMCNPPFHASMDEAVASNARKVRNLAKNKGKDKPRLSLLKAQENTPPSAQSTSQPNAKKANFGGQKAELWCPGGEIQFLTQMAKQSVQYAGQVGWFTSLVSKSENIPLLKTLLNQLGAKQVKVINMTQGQKISRLTAWRF